MNKILKTSNYYRKDSSAHLGLKSTRPQRFILEQALLIKKKAFKIFSVLALVFIIYLLFYSGNFRITEINLESSQNIDNNEASEAIRGIMGKFFLIFPQNNYFVINKGYIEKKFREKYIFSSLEIKKDFPHKINIKVSEKLNQLVLITNSKNFLINMDGLVISQVDSFDPNNTKIPIIYDLSNTQVDLNQTTLNAGVLKQIFDLFTNFNDYNLPVIEIMNFNVDSLNVNYFRLVTKQGFEIHFNTILSLEDQIYKLKRSLASGKIDLNKISYINLRIANQVIYK